MDTAHGGGQGTNGVATPVQVAVAGVVLATLLLLAAEPRRTQAQSPPMNDQASRDAAALAKANFEGNARALTVYDAQGQMVRTVGERAVYNWPAFSPDRTQLAVSKRDEATQTTDIWVLDVASGASRRITADPASDISPVWSPDGRQIIYGSNPGESPGLYRKVSNGAGSPELVYQDRGLPLYVSDWSGDGRFLSVNDPVNLYVLSLAERGPQKAIDVVLRGRAGRFSPDSRLLAYVSDQSGRPEIWVRTVAAPFGAAPAGPWRISVEGGAGMISWRQDGQELYYLAADQNVMAVQVGTDPTFAAHTPRVLFKAPETISGGISGTSVSRDGLHFLFTIPPKPRGTRFPTQVTVFDRQGTAVRTLVELRPDTTPITPMLSPDGTRVAIFLNADIWTFDVSTGNRARVTSSAPLVRTTGDQHSPVWSPDGSQLAFFSYRGALGHVFRVASTGAVGEERLYSHVPDIYSLPLTDWSPDGRFLTFDVGGVAWLLSLTGSPRTDSRGDSTAKAVELMREEYNVYAARFSPDSRYVAYVSDESGRNEVYVRPFDASSSTFASGGTKWQISRQGGLGMVQWRHDGRELLYLASDGGVMGVDVSTASAFRAGTPRRLFLAPSTFPLVGVFDRDGINAPGCSDATPGLERCEAGSISRDGQRFVFTVPLPPLRHAVAVAPRILTQYVGTYVERGIDWVVTLERDQLMVQRTGRARAPLFAESETKFFLKASNGDFEFVRDEAGAVRYMFMYRGGAPILSVRTPAGAAQ